MKKELVILLVFAMMSAIAFAEPVVTANNFRVYANGLSIIGEGTLCNTGSDMTRSWILEMQPRPRGQPALSWATSGEVCDSNHRENVHSTFFITAGQCIDIRLVSNWYISLGDYDVYFLSRTQCWPNERVSPWPITSPIYPVTVTGSSGTTSTVTTTVTATTIPQQGSPSITAYGMSVHAENQRIIADIDLINNGDAMANYWIIEMQPRPKGLLPLALYTEQQACDYSHPENVHVGFRLGQYERGHVQLVSPVLGAGDYDVYFLSRTKCYPNERVSPWPITSPIYPVTVTGSGSVAGLSQNAIVGIALIAGAGVFWFIWKKR